MSDELKLDLGAGDNLFVRELYQVLWADRQNGGRGLTYTELGERARLKWNTSAACQWYERAAKAKPYTEEMVRSDSERTISSARTIRVDRADPEWRHVVSTLLRDVHQRMTQLVPGDAAGGQRRPPLITSGAGRGQPPKGTELRWKINEIDGRPVLPRYYRKPQHLAGQWLDFDPEAERIGMASHLDVIAWLSEARAEQKRPKPRPVELAALVDRAIALLSVSGS